MGKISEVDIRHIGQKIRKARLAKGINQTELAARAGKSQAQISMLEVHKSVQVSVLQQVCEALGIHPCELLYGAGWHKHLDEELVVMHEKGNPMASSLMRLLRSEEGKALGINEEELKALHNVSSYFPMLSKESFLHILLTIRNCLGKSMLGGTKK